MHRDVTLRCGPLRNALQDEGYGHRHGAPRDRRHASPQVRVDHARVKTVGGLAGALESLGKLVGKEDVGELRLPVRAKRGVPALP